MKKLKHVTVLLSALMLASALPSAVTAASSTEITPSIQSSLDKTITGASSAQASKIKSLINDFQTLQKQEEDWDAKINSLHTSNEDRRIALNKQIKEIDAAILNQLEADAERTREKYKPLLSQYSAVNKQIEAAKIVNNKELNSMLRFQANVIRIPVQLARMDIKKKEEAWREAKDNASKTMKKIRNTLADIDPIHVQIKAKKSAIKTTETSRAPIWSSLKQTAKKAEASGVQSSLASLVSLNRQICEEQEKLFKLEDKISHILDAAKSQIP
ncbi:hypothetical protein [Paenibacillus sp. SI8]|uniref:hypothetical protein n=1 Tax=unclassified Paenibacillus TaxID=185978 RepID=UPI003465BD06